MYQNNITVANRNLLLLAPGVRSLAEKAVLECKANGLQVEIFEGWRSPERQLHLMNKGPATSRAAPGMSFHQYGLACDIAFFEQGKWNWAGDFKKPREIFLSYGFDPPPSFEQGHFQISNKYRIAEIKDMVARSTLQAAWIELGMDKELI